MKRMTDKAKKIYNVIYMTLSAVFAVATLVLGILYFTVENLKEVFIIKNSPIILAAIAITMTLIRILVEDVIFRKDFHTTDIIDTDNSNNKAERTNLQ